MVDVLRRRHVLGRSKRWLRGQMALVTTLAASVAFLLGRSSVSADRMVVTDTRWMLLLYEDSTFVGPTAGKEHEYVDEYRTWAAAVHATGAVIDGAELLAGGGVLVPGRPGLRAEEPTANPGGRLTGYFVITASTLEGAARIAANSPHARHRGRITIRPIGAS